MEVQWLYVGDTNGVGNNIYGHIMAVICRECNKTFLTEHYTLILPQEHNNLTTPLPWLNDGVNVKEIRGCPKCNYPVVLVEYVIEQHEKGPYLTRAINGRLKPISLKCLDMVHDVMSLVTPMDVARYNSVTPVYVREVVHRVYKRLLPDRWKLISDRTKAAAPLLKELLEYRDELKPQLKSLIINAQSRGKR